MPINSNKYHQQGYEGNDFKNPGGSYDDYKDAQRAYQNGAESRKSFDNRIKNYTDFFDNHQKVKLPSWEKDPVPVIFIRRLILNLLFFCMFFLVFGSLLGFETLKGMSIMACVLAIFWTIVRPIVMNELSKKQ